MYIFTVSNFARETIETFECHCGDTLSHDPVIGTTITWCTHKSCILTTSYIVWKIQIIIFIKMSCDIRNMITTSVNYLAVIRIVCITVSMPVKRRIIRNRTGTHRMEVNAEERIFIRLNQISHGLCFGLIERCFTAVITRLGVYLSPIVIVVSIDVYASTVFISISIKRRGRHNRYHHKLDMMT